MSETLRFCKSGIRSLKVSNRLITIVAHFQRAKTYFNERRVTFHFVPFHPTLLSLSASATGIEQVRKVIDY